MDGAKTCTYEYMKQIMEVKREIANPYFEFEVSIILTHLNNSFSATSITIRKSVRISETETLSTNFM